jgi:alkanesulfonate monooxygenase SsuD/methylene tetrahydromethanopterin reductase-like flavin-dependent oxidoreductase (luciferase family)
MEQIVLSAIDILWPGHIPTLVPCLDSLGYHRFWTTQHHGPVQSGSPVVLAAVAAGLAKRMRVGTAGVMLKAASPLKLAADFRLLELLYPGRMDLGVVGALPAPPIRQALLDGRHELDDIGYARKLSELVRLLDTSTVEVAGSVQAGPHTATVPQLWLCGTSRRSAHLAAELGLSFAYHHHEWDSEDRPVDGPSIVDAYRQAFRPSPRLSAPRTVVVAYGLCAEQGKQARRLWFPPIGLPANFLGAAKQCQDQLVSIAERYAASELVVQSVAHDLSARLDSYRLLADSFGLPARAERLPPNSKATPVPPPEHHRP